MNRPRWILLAASLAALGTGGVAALLRPAGADNADPFDRLKQQLATYETLRVWATAWPPLPEGEEYRWCKVMYRPWCPTSWVFTVTADGPMTADLGLADPFGGGSGVSHRTLVQDGEALTYEPGNEPWPQPSAAEALFLATATQFLRQELGSLPVTVGTAAQLGLPTGRLVVDSLPMYGVSRHVPPYGQADLYFVLNRSGRWVGLYARVGGQLTEVGIGGVEVDQPIPASWFDPAHYPHVLPTGSYYRYDDLEAPEP